VIDIAAIIIPTPNIDNPRRIMGILPLISEIAPENNWIIAKGNMNEGIVINNALGITENSIERTRKSTRITLPVSGPKAYRIKISNSIKFMYFLL
jgi:hypothetical protein